MDTDGKLLKTLNIDGLSKGKVIVGLDAGGYLIRHIIYDSLKIESEEPITVNHRYRPFVYELSYTKLNSNFKVEEIILSGGIGDTGYSPFVVRDAYLYNSALLHQDCEIDGVERKLSWSHGHFVRQHKIKTKP